MWNSSPNILCTATVSDFSDPQRAQGTVSRGPNETSMNHLLSSAMPMLCGFSVPLPEVAGPSEEFQYLELQLVGRMQPADAPCPHAYRHGNHDQVNRKEY